MEKPLVSVIVPVYNREKYLSLALDSILSQTYSPIELIVVDDGSTDQSAKIAKSYQQVHYIYQNNQGPAGARNTGIAQAKGHYLAFLDSDDLWNENKIAIQVQYLQENPDIECCLATVKNFLEQDATIPMWIKEEQIQTPQPGYLPSAMLILTQSFHKVGPFNPLYRVSEDSDWFIRAQALGIKKAILPDVLVYRRIHKDNASNECQPARQILLHSLKKFLDQKKKSDASQKT
ncbi:MAG: glycosyltransferase family 2 protein [Candidatus Brocadiae bacterium]|nr:glycosyltransferase family 2 protein [Candidatus Brocadiia bacterium]